MTQLVEGGAVETPADFYRLDVERAVSCGLTERQALLALGGIHLIPSPDQLENDELEGRIDRAKREKKRIPLAQLIAAFGIENAGPSAGKALVDYFASFDALREASVSELEAVEDVGAKTASVVHQYLSENAAQIDDLLSFVEPELPRTGKFSGKVFCFSGSFAAGKRHWEEQVESHGGKCTGSVSKKTDFLVAGPGSGSKSEKAEKLGVEILNINELQKMLGR